MRPEVESRQWLKDYVQNRSSWWYQLGIRAWVSQEYVYLVRYTRGGFPLESAVLDTIWLDRDTVQAVVEGECLAMLRKRDERRVVGEEKSTVQQDDWAKQYPLLWEYLTASRYPDGSPRVPSSMLIFSQDGHLKAMIRDKDAGLCLWVTNTGMDLLLMTVELALADDTTEWRVDREAGSAQKAKRRPGGGQLR